MLRISVLAATVLLALLHPARAETPVAACLSSNGQKLYNINPYRNIPRAECRKNDTLLRFQVEQPGTTVRKVRSTLTEPGSHMIASFGGTGGSGYDIWHE
jgi:hypothetical protein